VTLPLERRIARLEDRVAICDLAVLYGFVMDERDLGALPRLFAAGATLRSADGVFAASGLGEITETYRGRFAVLGATNHVCHGHVVRFDGADPDRARGLVGSHAEVVRDGAPMVVALRYKDQYVRTPAGWRFQDRCMSYMYYCDVRDLPGVLGSPLRNRAYGDERPADWPEALVAGSDPGWLRAFVAEPSLPR